VHRLAEAPSGCAVAQEHDAGAKGLALDQTQARDLRSGPRTTVGRARARLDIHATRHSVTAPWPHHRAAAFVAGTNASSAEDSATAMDEWQGVGWCPRRYCSWAKGVTRTRTSRLNAIGAREYCRDAASPTGVIEVDGVAPAAAHVEDAKLAVAAAVNELQARRHGEREPAGVR
jgi:hypothetical protein